MFSLVGWWRKERSMPLIAYGPTPIEVPRGVDHYEFFASLLDVALGRAQANARRQPPPTIKEEDVPPAPVEWMWHCFFVAAPAMVARRTPSLLGLWDIRSGQFC